MGMGCKLKCKCSAVCGCYDGDNNHDDGKCRGNGDSGATCNDNGGTGYECSCSTGYTQTSDKKSCVDINGCSGNTCSQDGDSGATCNDVPAPGTGFTCSCSSGWESVGGVCRPKTCNDVNLPTGYRGTGDDACYSGLVLDAIHDTTCDFGCVPGYTGVSSGTTSRYTCQHSAGNPTTSYQCDENQCNVYHLPTGVVGSGDSPCTDGIQLSASTHGSCGITCDDGFWDAAALYSKVTCLPSGGIAGVTLDASAVYNNCGGDASTLTDSNALTFWNPTSCTQGGWQVIFDLSVSFSLTSIRLDSFYDGQHGVTSYAVHTCSSEDPTTCSQEPVVSCTGSTSMSSCSLDGMPASRFVMLEVTGTQGGNQPYLHSVEFFMNFGCVEHTTCYPGTYVSVTPTSTQDRQCEECPSGQTSSGVNPTSCIEEDGCLNNYCGDFGSCVDVPAPGVGYTCECQTGYRFQSGVCIDDDHCESHTCTSNGDSEATCTDRQAPAVGYDCECSLGYEDVGGVCVDVDACSSSPCQSAGDTDAVCTDEAPPSAGNTCACSSSGAFESTLASDGITSVCTNVDGCAPRITGSGQIQPCQEYGDSSATCFDHFAPEIGNGCICSTGYHVVSVLNSEECFPDACEGNPLIAFINNNGICDDTPSGAVCHFQCAPGYSSDGPMQCTLGVWQVDTAACVDALAVGSPVSDIATHEDASLGIVDISNLFIVDDDAESTDVEVSIASIVPDDALVASISAGNLTLTLNPDAFGTVVVTLEGSVGSNTELSNFTVTITPVDDGPRVAGSIDTITIDEDSPVLLKSLTDVFTDPDDAASDFTLTVLSGSWASIVSMTIVDDILRVEPLEHQFGNSSVSIRCVSNGKSVETSFELHVLPVNDAVHVETPISQIEVNEDDEATVVDLRNVFRDVDGSVTNITVISVHNNAYTTSEAPIKSATITREETAWDMTIAYGENAFGSAVIMLRATSDDTTEVDLEVDVTVSPVDDPPYVQYAIEDVVYAEDSGAHTISVSETFEDIDSAVEIQIVGNSNPGLVATSMTDATTLSITPTLNANGQSTITLRGQSGAQYVDTSFIVFVTPVDDGPSVASGIGNMETFEDSEFMLQNLAGAYDDVDGDMVVYHVMNCAAFGSDKSCCATSDCSASAAVELSANSEVSCRTACALTRISAEGCCQWTDTDSMCRWLSSSDEEAVMHDVAGVAASRCAFPDIVDEVTPPMPWASIVKVDVIDGQTLRVEPLLHQHGAATVEVVVVSNGKTLVDSFEVVINAVNDPVAINRTVANLAVYEDSDDANVALNGVFVDVDNSLASIEVAAVSNSDLIVASVSNVNDEWNLRLEFSSDASGSCVVSLRAVSEDTTSIELDVNVVVIPVDDAPVVLSSVPDQTFEEDALARTISVGGVFGDIDSVVEIEVAGNSNPNVASVALDSTSTTLTITPLSDANGYTDITLRGVSMSYGVTDTFRVTVIPSDDAPRVVAPISSRQIVEDSTPIVLDVSNVFADVDGDVVTLLSAVVVPEGVLESALQSADGTLTLSPLPDANGAVVVTLTAEANSKTVSTAFNVAVLAMDDGPRINADKLEQLDDAASVPSSCDSAEYCVWHWNETGLFYDIDSSAMTVTITCSDADKVTPAITAAGNIRIEYLPSMLPSNYTVLCALVGTADGESRTQEFSKVFSGTASSDASMGIEFSTQQTAVMGLGVVAFLVALVSCLCYYRRRVRKKEVAMDRVVKRAEAELISVASRQWLEDDLAMSRGSINIDSPHAVESYSERHSRLQNHIDALRSDNKRMKETNAKMSLHLSEVQEKFHGEISEQGAFVGTLDGGTVPFPEIAAASPTPSGRSSFYERSPPPPDMSDL